MRWFALLGVLSLTACSSGSPTSPNNDPPPPELAIITGTLTATNGGQALDGVTISTPEGSATTAGGSFALTVPRGSAVPLTISGPGITTRTGFLDRQTHSVNLSVFGPGFDLAYYRDLVRGQFSFGSLRSLTRWTRNPKVYLRTVNELGAAVPASTLDIAQAAISDSIGAWTGNSLTVESFERGPETKEGVSGYMTLQVVTPIPGVCGLATGIDGGSIKIVSGGTCQCGPGSPISPRNVRHELGHAMGLSHSQAVADVMLPGGFDCTASPSAKEREYAAYLYSRPVGNTDLDSDSTIF